MPEPLLFEVLLLLVSLVALPLPWLGLEPALAILPYFGRNFFYLGRLSLLIYHHHRMAPPFPHGLWGVIYRFIA